MTKVAPRPTTSARLQQALAALKHAENDRRFLEDGTPEHARAIEREETLSRDVYQLAAAIDNDAPERTTGPRHPV
jgi:hypothetical protein